MLFRGHTCHFEFDVLICDGFEQTIDACKEGRKPCPHSHHACNKKNLWEVADTLDHIECEHTCCRNCEVRMVCGARCNGADDVSQCNEDCETCGRYTTATESNNGKIVTYSCIFAGKTVVKEICEESNKCDDGGWILCTEKMPESSGYYSIRDIKGNVTDKVWFEKTIGFNHATHYTVKAWKSV